MPANPKFAEQLRRARKEYELRHGDITQEQLGARVAEWLRDPKGYSAAMANKWFGGKGEPSFSVGVAIFAVLEADLAEAARATYVRREPPAATGKRKKQKNGAMAGIARGKGTPLAPAAKKKRKSGGGSA